MWLVLHLWAVITFVGDTAPWFAMRLIEKLCYSTSSCANPYLVNLAQEFHFLTEKTEKKHRFLRLQPSNKREVPNIRSIKVLGRLFGTSE